MKVSSLNRFKGKIVKVSYRDDDDEPIDQLGFIEAVDIDDITLEDEAGLTVIPLDSLRGIWDADKIAPLMPPEAKEIEKLKEWQLKQGKFKGAD